MKIEIREDFWLNKIDPDNYTLVHLLGYLKPEQWADALRPDLRLNKDLVAQLMRKQENRFKFDLITDVEEILGDKK